MFWESEVFFTVSLNMFCPSWVSPASKYTVR
jgi:hypothetical protein